MNVGAILIHRTQMNAGPPRRTHRAAFHGSTGCARGTKGCRCVRNVGSRTRKRLVEWHIIFKIIESFHILHFLWFRQTMDLSDMCNGRAGVAAYYGELVWLRGV